MKNWGSTILIGCMVFIQTSFLKHITIAGTQPDIALVLLVFFANLEGRMKGQLLGFGSGIIEDLLSLSPLGFNALIKTILGFLYGITRGKIFVDPLFMPIILVGIASVVKMLLSLILVAIFIGPEMIPITMGSRMWIEAGFNCLLAPFVFAILKIFKIYRSRQERF